MFLIVQENFQRVLGDTAKIVSVFPAMVGCAKMINMENKYLMRNTKRKSYGAVFGALYEVLITKKGRKKLDGYYGSLYNTLGDKSPLDVTVPITKYASIIEFDSIKDFVKYKYKIIKKDVRATSYILNIDNGPLYSKFIMYRHSGINVSRYFLTAFNNAILAKNNTPKGKIEQA